MKKLLKIKDRLQKVKDRLPKIKNSVLRTLAALPIFLTILALVPTSIFIALFYVGRLVGLFYGPLSFEMFFSNQQLHIFRLSGFYVAFVGFVCVYCLCLLCQTIRYSIEETKKIGDKLFNSVVAKSTEKS